MALPRKMLEAMGIEQNKIDSIMEGHSETVSGLQAKIKELEGKLEASETALKDAKGRLENVDTSKDWKSEAEKAQKALADYKHDVEERDAHKAKEEAYRRILRDAGIADKRIDTVLAASMTAVGNVKFDADGNVEGRDELVAAAAKDWEDIIPKTVRVSAKAPKPPENTGATLTREDILQIKDTQERQKAIAENIDLFTKKQ